MKFPAVSPVITKDPQDQNVTSFEGIIILSCEATGFPAPVITWFHNDTEVNDTTYTSEQVNAYTTNSTLTRMMPDSNDTGDYYCQASVEGYEEVNSDTALVLVQGKHLKHGTQSQVTMHFTLTYC